MLSVRTKSETLRVNSKAFRCSCRCLTVFRPNWCKWKASSSSTLRLFGALLLNSLVLIVTCQLSSQPRIDPGSRAGRASGFFQQKCRLSTPEVKTLFGAQCKFELRARELMGGVSILKNGIAQLALIAVISCNSLPVKSVRPPDFRLFCCIFPLFCHRFLTLAPPPPPNFYFISQLLNQEISIRQHSVNFCRATRGVNFYLMHSFFPFFSPSPPPPSFFLAAELNLGSLQFMIQFPICPPEVFSWWAVLCFCSRLFVQQSPLVFISVLRTHAFQFPILRRLYFT